MSSNRTGCANVARAARDEGACPYDGGPDDLLGDATALSILRNGLSFTAVRRGVSERTLRRQFQRAGISLSRHLVEKRRVLSILMLASGSPIAEIAETLGFSSPQTFARFVRRELRTTATALRRYLVMRYGATLPIELGGPETLRRA